MSNKQWYHCRKWQSSKILFVRCVITFVKKNFLALNSTWEWWNPIDKAPQTSLDSRPRSEPALHSRAMSRVHVTVPASNTGSNSGGRQTKYTISGKWHGCRFKKVVTKTAFWLVNAKILQKGFEKKTFLF